MRNLTYLIFILNLMLLVSGCKNSETESSENTAQKAVAVKSWAPEDTRSITGFFAERGLKLKDANSTEGYVLFHPGASTATYLMDMDGQVVHIWDGKFNCMQAYLKDNGNLLRLERDPDFPTFAAGGQGGRIIEYDWEGNVIWDFKLATEKNLTHHDIEILPNGNILAITYDAVTKEEAISIGRDPAQTPEAGIWLDKIVEIKPSGTNAGEIVWEWRMIDHLVQDQDDSKLNYGDVAKSPRKFNLNPHEAPAEGPPPMTEEQIQQMIAQGFMTSNATVENMGSDFAHVNAIGYNPEMDQIVISSPHYHEIYIIDHSTTTEEAKGTSGGNAGHGGDILFRWGNPSNYDRGSGEDQILFGQHDVKWIPQGYPGAGHLMVFNNDIPAPENQMPGAFEALMAAQSPDPQISIAQVGNTSAVLEFQPAMDASGAYLLGDEGPFTAEIVWQYQAPDKYSFYSPFISGAHRMENGHTFITSGGKGRFFEVDQEGNLLWDYWMPYYHDYKLADGTRAQPVGPFLFSVFRATHFTPDAEALQGKTLKPVSPQPEPFVPEQG